MRPALVLVPVAGLLFDPLPGGDQVDLPAGLVADGPPERPQRVDVLDFATGPELRLPDGADRHVAVHPHRALLHLPIGGADGHQDGPQLTHVGSGLLSRAQVWGTDNFDEWNAGPVVVDQRVTGLVDPTSPTHMGAFARVLLEVGPLNTHPAPIRQFQPALPVDREVVLGDLEVLWHIRVEVVLAGEN